MKYTKYILISIVIIFLFLLCGPVCSMIGNGPVDIHSSYDNCLTANLHNQIDRYFNNYLFGGLVLLLSVFFIALPDNNNLSFSNYRHFYNPHWISLKQWLYRGLLHPKVY